MTLNITNIMLEGFKKTFLKRNFGDGLVIALTAISSTGSSEINFLQGRQNSSKYVGNANLCCKF